MHFEELSPGDKLEPMRVNVEGWTSKLLAVLLEDPNPPHYDELTAANLGFEGLLNHGPANLSYMLQPILKVLDSPSDLLSVDVRFNDMVFAGETVMAEASVEDMEATQEYGIVDFEITLRKPDDTVAVSGTATARFQID